MAARMKQLRQNRKLKMAEEAHKLKQKIGKYSILKRRPSIFDTNKMVTQYLEVTSKTSQCKEICSQIHSP